MGAPKHAPDVQHMTVRKRKGPVKSKYKKQMEELLKNYPTHKYSIASGALEASLRYEFPSLTASYSDEAPGHSEYRSTTEKYGIKRAETYVQVQQVERALALLDPEERRIIEACYFGHRSKWSGVLAFIDKLGMSKSTYHRIKSGAIEKMAFVLGLK